MVSKKIIPIALTFVFPKFEFGMIFLLLYQNSDYLGGKIKEEQEDKNCAI